MPPVVCKFWQQGSCRFGDRCRFEHPPLDRSTPTSNRFSTLHNPDNSNIRNDNVNHGGSSTGRVLPYSLDKTSIVADLSTERPQWILSAYGPGRNAPAQLFGGSIREQSFEEMRLLHCIGLRSGNAQSAVQEAEKLFQASEQQIQAALNNVDGAINFIINAEKDHPNRIDIVQKVASGAGSNPNPFSQGINSNNFQAAPAASNPFGVPPLQLARTSTNEPSSMQPAVDAFGRPSAFGQKSTPFGAPLQSFGANSQLGAAGGFGRPSALGQKLNPFGGPSTTPAPLSSFAKIPNPFAQQPQSITSNAFGAPSQPATSTIALGASPQQAQANPFGQPSAQSPRPFLSSNEPSQPGPFGNTTSKPFGVPSPAPNNPFGAPKDQTHVANMLGGSSSAASQRNPFGPGPVTIDVQNQPTKLSPFSIHPTAPNPVTANPFGNPSLPTASNAVSKPFGATSQQPELALNGDTEETTLGPGTSLGHPPLNSYSSMDLGGRLTTFRGKRVVYRNDEAGFHNMNGTWTKIWFPEGAPGYYKDTEMENSEYNDRIEAAYMHVRQMGSFQGAVMPMVPPKREWCLWNF